jgi:hypothetical protein
VGRFRVDGGGVLRGDGKEEGKIRERINERKEKREKIWFF